MRHSQKLVTCALCWVWIQGCSLLATRPVQLMSDTSAAIRAAKDAQADTLSPEYFRQANEWFFRAKREYKYKNFSLTQTYAEKAKRFAEMAEFESIKSGGSQGLSESEEIAVPPPPPAEKAAESPIEPEASMSPYPEPQGTPADEYEERKAAEDSAKKKIKQSPQKSGESTPEPEPGPYTPGFQNRPVIRK